MIILTLQACGDKKLNGGYEIDSSEEFSQLELVYTDEEGNAVTVIEENIVGVGQNSDFIIVKQHPPTYGNVNYCYIIPLKNKISTSFEKNIIGPLVGSSFDDERRRLGVPENLNFNVLEK